MGKRALRKAARGRGVGWLLLLLLHAEGKQQRHTGEIVPVKVRGRTHTKKINPGEGAAEPGKHVRLAPGLH